MIKTISPPHESTSARSDEYPPRALLICIATALALFAFLRISGSTMIDVDVWHEMSLARELLRTGHFPAHDPFSYTPTVPFIHHEWGSGLISYVVAVNFGGLGLLLLKYALASAIASLCLLTAARRNSRPILLFACMALQIHLIGFAFATVRAHLYSLLMIAALLYFLEMDHRNIRRWIPLWLFLCVLWVNLHGGIAVGIGLLIADGIERIFTRKPAIHLLFVAAIMAIIIAANPWGWHYYPRFWHALWMPRPGMSEWRPFLPSASLDFILFAASIATLIYCTLTVGWRNMRGLAIVLATLAGAALHFRMAPFYGVAFCCYVPAFLQQTPAARRMEAFVQREKLLIAGVSAIFALIAVSLAIHNHPFTVTVPARDSNDKIIYPVAAVDYLKNTNFRGSVYVPFLYGAYVSWRLYPEVLISVDSRYEVAYQEWLVDEQTNFYAARPGWRQDFLDKYTSDLVLVSRQAPVAPLMNSTGWCQFYTDPDYEIYSRRLCTPTHVTSSRNGQFP